MPVAAQKERFLLVDCDLRFANRLITPYTMLLTALEIQSKRRNR